MPGLQQRSRGMERGWANRLNSRFTGLGQGRRLSGSNLFHPPFHTMGNLKKKRRLKMNKHKRRKRLKSNRHKKRTWQK
jgi:hypothetical protein